MRCTVRACKQDLDDNPIGHESKNLILNTFLYDVEFLDGKLTLLTANAIVQAMYAQCDINRNEYILLECSVDVQKDPTAISCDEMKHFIMAGRTYTILP